MWVTAGRSFPLMISFPLIATEDVSKESGQDRQKHIEQDHLKNLQPKIPKFAASVD